MDVWSEAGIVRALRMLDISKAEMKTEGKLMHTLILSGERDFPPYEEAANQRL